MLEIGERKLKKFGKIDGAHWIGGVCSGAAYWLGLPVWLVRLIWTILLLGYGVGGLAYILLWIFLPAWDELPKDFKEVTGD